MRLRFSASVLFSVLFEELNGLFVLFRGGARVERAEVSSLPRLGVLLAGVQAVLARFELPDHRGILPAPRLLRRRLNAILDFADPFLIRTVNAAVEVPVRFDPVANDSAPAVTAGRGQGMDRTFEAVEAVRFSRHHHIERLVIVVSANFTNAHFILRGWSV